MTSIWDEKNVIQPYEAGFVLVDEEWLEKLKLQWEIMRVAIEVYDGYDDPIVTSKVEYDKLKEKAHLWNVSYDQTLKDAHRTANEFREKAKMLDAYINCPGNCELAWHDCGCGMLDTLRVVPKP